MLIDPFIGVELVMLAVVLVLMLASLGVLCFATRIGLGMGKMTWRALFWTSGVLTGLSFLATVLHMEGLRALLSVPFVFAIWVLALLPFFYFGSRRRQRSAGQTRPPENSNGPHDR